MTVTDVTLTREEIEDRVRQLGQKGGQTGLAGAKARGRLAVWRKLLERSRQQEDAEMERRRAVRETTREEAMQLVRRLRGAPDSGTATSRVAAEAIREEVQTLRMQVLVLLLMRPYGLTDQQIQRVLSMPPDTERPRRWELSEKLGLVLDSGRTRETTGGNDATVWVAWKHAREQAEMAI